MFEWFRHFSPNINNHVVYSIDTLIYPIRSRLSYVIISILAMTWLSDSMSIVFKLCFVGKDVQQIHMFNGCLPSTNLHLSVFPHSLLVESTNPHLSAVLLLFADGCIKIHENPQSGFPIFGFTKTSCFNMPKSLDILGQIPSICTFWYFNIAIENGPFIVDLPIKDCLVGGFKHLDYFPYIGNNDPNWRTPSFFRGVGIPPTSCDFPSLFVCSIKSQKSIPMVDISPRSSITFPL